MLRAFVLRGPCRELALDLLHIHAAVHGAVEAEDGVTVWLAGEPPASLFATPPLGEFGVADLRVEELPAAAANLEATGLEQDRPILVERDLLVRPPWVDRPAGFVGVELIVPRGMAFGSGEHDSTKAALRMLHANWRAPASVLDVGTGSGILALYASVRGCARVLACDIEDAAVAAARELMPQASVHLGGPEAVPEAADLVIANMTGSELLAALDAILAKWTRRGPLVLSGMRDGEDQAVRARLPRPADGAMTVGAFTALVVRPPA